ncbi:hypothetical protein [Haloplanus salilacus]|uniref:hypothetical protein n=1 Tax=Haloplanus salilacus TaxID=2949994 RepID=UPI0030D4638C
MSNSLPPNFFESLTQKQEALLTVLVDSNTEYTSGEKIREQTRNEYEFDVPDHPGATAGVVAGFTNRYSKQFSVNLVPARGVEGKKGHYEFKLGETYTDEIRDRLG